MRGVGASGQVGQCSSIVASTSAVPNISTTGRRSTMSSFLDRFRKHQGDDQLEFWPEERDNRKAFRLALFVIVSLIIALFAVPAFAQDYQGRWGETHKEYHQQYKKLYNQLGTHCCTDKDCTRTTARFNSQTGRWEALVEGIWRDIDPSRHVRDAYGLTENAHVCFTPSAERGKEYIFCFVPPALGG